MAKGLVTYYTLFMIDLKTRRVHIAGSTPNPNGAFMAQAARNLTDVADGFLLPHRVLICDRDTKFTEQFRRILKDASVDTVLTPRRALDCNAFAERFVRSIKEECLNRMIMLGEPVLHRAIAQFIEYYHQERPHQGLDNAVIDARCPSLAKRRPRRLLARITAKKPERKPARDAGWLKCDHSSRQARPLIFLIRAPGKLSLDPPKLMRDRLGVLSKSKRTKATPGEGRCGHGSEREGRREGVVLVRGHGSS